MKTTKKFFLFKKSLLLSLISISLTLTGCSLFPKTENDTYQNPDGSITEETVTTKGKTTIKETVTTKPDGTIIEKTKTEDEDGNSEWEQITTFPDGSVGIETGTETYNDNGDVLIKSEEIVTYSETNTSGKKTEKITYEEDNTDLTKGCVKTKTIETEFKDGHKEKITDHYEPLTGITTKETIITDEDGSSVETDVKITEGCTETTKLEKNASGNLTKKIVKVEYTDWRAKGSNPDCSEKTYEYPNGTETLVKDYSLLIDDNSNTIETTIEGGKTTVETTSSNKNCYEKKVDDVEKEAEFFFSDGIVVKVDILNKKANYKVVNVATVTFNTNYNYQAGDYIIKFNDEVAPTVISVGKDSGNLTDYSVSDSIVIDESKLHVKISS